MRKRPLSRKGPVARFAIESAIYVLETKARHHCTPQGGDQLTLEVCDKASRELCERAAGVLREFDLLEEGLFRGNIRIRKEKITWQI